MKKFNKTKITIFHERKKKVLGRRPSIDPRKKKQHKRSTNKIILLKHRQTQNLYHRNSYV